MVEKRIEKAIKFLRAIAAVITAIVGVFEAAKPLFETPEEVKSEE